MAALALRHSWPRAVLQPKSRKGSRQSPEAIEALATRFGRLPANGLAPSATRKRTGRGRMPEEGTATHTVLHGIREQ